MKALDAFRQLTDFLNQENVPYMIVGSFSSNYHGLPRSTNDADIVLEFDHASWSTLASRLPKGLSIDPQGSFEMVTSTRKEILLVEDSIFEIEVFHLSDDPFDKKRFSRREKVELTENQSAWVATAEDVIVQKLRWNEIADRSKDYDDVVNVLKRKADSLDFTYIKHWCGLHETIPLLEKAREAAAS